MKLKKINQIQVNCCSQKVGMNAQDTGIL